MRTSTHVVLCVTALFAATASAESLEAVLARSEAAYARHQLDEAVAILEARLKLPDPDDNLVPVHGTLGELYLEMDQPEKALAHFDWIAAEHPNYSRAHYMRGLALEKSARSLEAIDAYALAGEQYYDEVEIRSRIGFNYVLLANNPDTPDAERAHYRELARKSLTRAVTLDPRNLSAMGNLADIVFSMGEFKRALDFYQRMDEIEPSRPMTLARIGNTYLQLGQCATAVEILHRAAKILNESKPRTQVDADIYRDVEVYARIRAAECLVELGRAVEARGEIERVLEIAACRDCKATSREIDRAKSRADELLSRLKTATPANADTAR